jgi:phosphotransferase system HPr (HPr) family protein
LDNVTQSTIKREVTIVNPQGLHLRPAYMFAQLAGKYEAEVHLVKEGERVDGKSILSIVTLGAAVGTRLWIETKGPDAEQALAELAELVAAGFPAPAGEEATNTQEPSED